MNKVLSVAVLLALSTASDEFSDNNLNFISKVKEDLKKAGHFVAEHPEVVTTAAKILSKLDDEITDDEFNFISKVKEDLKKAGHFVAEHPEIISTAAKLLKDDEIANEELFKIPKPQLDVKIHFDETADDELNAKDVLKKIGSGLLTGAKIASKFLDDETLDQELFKIPKPKVDIGIHFDENGNELFNIHKPIMFDDEELFHIPKPTIEAKIHFDEAADDELNAKDVLKKIGSGLLTGAKIASKFLDDESADQELFKIPKPKVDIGIHFDENGNELFHIPKPTIEAKIHFDEDGNELFKIPKPKVDIGIHFDENGNELFNVPKPRIGTTVLHPTVQFDDEELFHIPKPTIEAKIHFDEAADDELNAKDVLKKIGSGLLTGAKIASKFLDDESADQELFHIPKPTIEAKIHFDEAADDELNAKDVLKKVGQGLLTGVKIASKFLDDESADQELFKIPKPKVDIGIHFDENGNELFHIPKPTIEAKIHFDEDGNELFAAHHNQTQHHEAIKKAQRDVKHSSELLRKLHHNQHHRNGTHHDSLSTLGQLLHEAHQI